jgi:hypothetical protein
MWTKNDHQDIFTKRENSLSPDVLGLLIGTTLGDGHLAKLRKSELAYLKVGNKDIKFVEYKLDLFKDILRPDTEINRWEYKGKISHHFNTIAHPGIYKLYKKMYVENDEGKLIKVVSEEIFDDLTVAGLALWYMDDGYLNRKRHQYFFSTCNFTLEEHHLIREQLRKKFDIYTTIMNNQGYYKLYVASRSREQLEKLLKYFVPPCMQYKYGAQIQNPQRLNVSPS